MREIPFPSAWGVLMDSSMDVTIPGLGLTEYALPVRCHGALAGGLLPGFDHRVPPLVQRLLQRLVQDGIHLDGGARRERLFGGFQRRVRIDAVPEAREAGARALAVQPHPP